MGKYRRKYIGMKFKTSDSLGGYEVEIIDGGDRAGYVYVKFTKPVEFIKEIRIYQLKRGEVKNPYHPSIHGWASFGENPAIPSRTNGKMSSCYGRYVCMVSRCYNPKDSAYNDYGGAGITISEEWRTYSAYSHWYKDNYIEGYHLDKDVLQNSIPKNEKIYSPETCCFISNIENIIEANIRRDYSSTSGYNHPAAKDAKYYENNSSLRSDFKRRCKTHDWDFNDFDEIFAEWHYNKNGIRKRKYFYKHKK